MKLGGHYIKNANAARTQEMQNAHGYKHIQKGIGIS